MDFGGSSLFKSTIRTKGGPSRLQFIVSSQYTCHHHHQHKGPRLLFESVKIISRLQPNGIWKVDESTADGKQNLNYRMIVSAMIPKHDGAAHPLSSMSRTCHCFLLAVCIASGCQIGCSNLRLYDFVAVWIVQH
jgi:hypothetical protein